jgi:glycosyltransferase involved in cell wall biosynthesis
MIMKIIFDNQIFNSQKFGGISRYHAELMSGLYDIGVDYCCNLKYTSNVHAIERNLYSKSLKKFNYCNFPFLQRLSSKSNINSNFEKYNSLPEFDLFHPTYYSAEFLPFLKSTPFVLTVHDMIHEKYLNNYFQFNHEDSLNKKILIECAKSIIAVSHATKKDIIEIYPHLDPDKITVIHHGNNFYNISDNVIILKHQHNFPFKDYILYVGNRKYYKNFFPFIKSIQHYVKKNKLPILCAGGSDFDSFELSYIKKLNLDEFIKHTPIISENHKYELYKNALAFVFPSIIEGFGMPILEAFSANCPVILSDIPCFNEIANDAATYFNISSPESIYKAFDLVLFDKNYRLDKLYLARKRISNFTWSDSVQLHLSFYEKIVNCSK